ncbi:MAG: 4-hydroxy-tetrahydrodipicolinate reductase [Deltaproteobacteria bacterium HGW-Deltaproteobacteria-14]|jgi:4-hydroxy-tetrahydrodipicolinate reductase|nr:MAG: 4-hydroxy-tetrahydrodipicolinate reductase [Deltaproteobacteria bacterium HGW-Deltaproteobacteria-14]
MKRLAIVGARGRMGRRLVALAGEYAFSVSAAIDADGPALADAARRADVVIDFSARAQVSETCAYCATHDVPLVLGTTGLEAADHAALDRLAEVVAVVQAPNFSVGVNALFDLVAEAARLLNEGWDVELVEAHHKHKVDAPSGTAKELARRVAEARGWSLDAAARHGREGLVGARPAGELGIHAVRGGSVVGEHRMLFLGEGEEVVLEHRALDRDIFVRGALVAARWLADGRAPGRYGMGDVLRTR